MRSSEWLEEILALFQEKIPEADFYRAHREKPGSRTLSRPVVTGEVDSEIVKPASEETRLRFRIYLPEKQGLETAESIFAAMCKLAGEKYSGFSAISRGAAERDKVTGLLAVNCSLSFLTQGAAGSPGDGSCKVLLGGREYQISGSKTTVSRSAKNLVSIGETEPFASLNAELEYTVELEGIDTAGLDKLASFTAELGTGGEKSVYQGCRWKQISDVLRRAVFVSAVKEGAA